MTDENNQKFRSLLTRMAEDRERYIIELMELHKRGVTVGSPSIADIIDRESKAAQNLRDSIALLDSWTS